jgi:serine/threonine protein kinase
MTRRRRGGGRSTGSKRKDSLLERYQMGDIIGEGSFGIVYIATNKKSGAVVRTDANYVHM